MRDAATGSLSCTRETTRSSIQRRHPVPNRLPVIPAPPKTALAWREKQEIKDVEILLFSRKRRYARFPLTLGEGYLIMQTPCFCLLDPSRAKTGTPDIASLLKDAITLS